VRKPLVHRAEGVTARHVGEARHRLEEKLQQVEEELGNVGRAILAGVVSETTTALVQDREALRRSLKERLGALETHRGTGPLRADTDTITEQLARLNDLPARDVARANAFFRAHVAPTICAPMVARRGGAIAINSCRTASALSPPCTGHD
jgi:hypothetical protein